MKRVKSLLWDLAETALDELSIWLADRRKRGSK